MVFRLSLFELLLGAFFCSCATILFLYAAAKLAHRAKTSSAETSFSAEPRDVLVGTLRNTSQLETCTEKNFYHIPALRLSQNDFPVRYVAIYRSHHKFGSDAGISIYGKVSKCSLVPRCKITEIPKNSSEMYYRFDIEEWKTLPAQISAGERDFINIMTTRYLLENARSAEELTLASREEHALYRKITSCISGEASEKKILFGENALLFDNGRISLMQDKTELFSCTYAEFSRRPAAVFRLMMNYITGKR